MTEDRDFFVDEGGFDRFIERAGENIDGIGSRPGYRFFKRVVDCAAAIFGLLLVLPVFPFVALLIRLETPGPIFFSQRRIGFRGRSFSCLKFRSMELGAEGRKDELRHLNEATGAAFKIKRDPRITGVGAFLRRSSLDEFPQLLNVLRGDMSIVGPRPQIPAEVSEYSPADALRLAVRPGLTCLWQISGRSQLDCAEWMELDREYVRRCGPGFDIWILARTLPAVIARKGAY